MLHILLKQLIMIKIVLDYSNRMSPEEKEVSPFCTQSKRLKQILLFHLVLMRPDLRELVEMQFMVQDRKTVIGRTRSVVCLQAEILAQTGFCQIKRVLLHQDKH